jgi:hypothetical protein
MADSDSFLVTKDDGTTLRVRVIRSRVDTSTMDGESSIPGLAQLRLDDGTPVNVIDENTYKIVSTGETVRRKR